jgi:hypothetical protein
MTSNVGAKNITEKKKSLLLALKKPDSTAKEFRKMVMSSFADL